MLASNINTEGYCPKIAQSDALVESLELFSTLAQSSSEFLVQPPVAAAVVAVAVAVAVVAVAAAVAVAAVAAVEVAAIAVAATEIVAIVIVSSAMLLVAVEVFDRNLLFNLKQESGTFVQFLDMSCSIAVRQFVQAVLSLHGYLNSAGREQSQTSRVRTLTGADRIRISISIVGICRWSRVIRHLPDLNFGDSESMMRPWKTS